MDNPSKILIIVPFFTLGGAETQAVNVAVALKKAGHLVQILAFEKKNGILIDKLESLNLECKLYPFDLKLIHKGGIKKIIKIFLLGKFIRSLKVDYLFPFTYYPNLLTSLIWRFTGAKKCFWNQRGLEKLGVSKLESLAKLMKPDYIANSNVCASFIAKRHKLEVSKVQVIRNGVNKEGLDKKSSWDEIEKITKDKLVFAMVANFYPEKKHVNMLKAWSEATNNDPGKLLIFVGYSPNEIYILKAKATAYDLELNNVLFLPSSNNIDSLLKNTDVGVLISESEGCPNSVLEYMKYSLPVIASDIPAIQEVFSNQNPLLKNLNDINGLAQAIEQCFNEEFRDQLGIENYKLVNSRFAMRELSSNYLNLL